MYTEICSFTNRASTDQAKSVRARNSSRFGIFIQLLRPCGLRELIYKHVTIGNFVIPGFKFGSNLEIGILRDAHYEEQ